MYALYAFARQTDDLGDDAPGPHEKGADGLLAICRNLEAWRTITARALLGAARRDDRTSPADAKRNLPLQDCPDSLRHTAELLLPALADTVQRFAIPTQYLLDLIDGVLADQTQTRFQSFEQLEHYCYQVASSIGLACLHIWGFRPSLPHAAAIDCGVAFQLTNILRDVREDAQRDRIYLPREFWNAGDVTESEILTAQPTPGLLHILATLSARARTRYQSGWEVFAHIHPDGRPMFSMMWRTYRKLQQTLDDDPDRGLRRRARLNTWQKLHLLGSHGIPAWFRRLPPPREQSGPAGNNKPGSNTAQHDSPGSNQTGAQS